MNFTRWLENRRETAKAYKMILQDVPQDPHHHPEGDVLTHSKLVRKAVPRAIKELRKLQQEPIFSKALENIDFNVTPEEKQILYISAWLHDIGKSTATTIGGQPWKTKGAIGKIQAIGHEFPKHYHPQIEKFINIAPPETVQLYMQNKELINFIIEHHMDFTSGNGFSKSFISQNFDGPNIRNTPEMKLLLIIMWADKIGRKPEDTIEDAIEKNNKNLLASVQKSILKSRNIENQTKPFDGGPEELAQLIRGKKMPQNKKIDSLKSKFPYLTDDQISKLLENFRNFLEMTETQPTTISANIPIDDNVKLLSKALKQEDQSVGVYVVGGAVRDYLYHIMHSKEGSTYKPKDVDITTNLSEEEILQRLRSPFAVEQGIYVKEKTSVDTFGVVFAMVNHENYEIAPFRKDIGGSDGRRPESVERGSIQDDAMRRDLTINNLYYDFDKGVILDFNPNGQGIKDIQTNSVRSVGDPNERFAEDKLRVLRLVRLFSRFNPGYIKDNLDDQHLIAIDKFKDLKGITPERIESELSNGIKQSMKTSGFLKNLAELDLMKRIFPNLQVDIQGIDRLGNLKNTKVILAWLLRNNKNIDKALNALKYPSYISEKVNFLIDAMNFENDSAFDTIKNRDKRLLKPTAKNTYGSPMTPEDVDTHNQKITSENQKDLNDLAAIVGNPSIAKKLNHLGTYQPPKIDAKELMTQGFKGPDIGKHQIKKTSDHYSQSLQDHEQ